MRCAEIAEACLFLGRPMRASQGPVRYRLPGDGRFQWARMTTDPQDRLWRNCPVCQAERSDPHWNKADLRIVRCVHCGMLFANPVERQYVTGDFYEELARPFYLSPDKLAGDYADSRFARERRLLRRHCPRGRVLDVGCSTGGFLHSLRSHHPGDYEILGADVAGPALDHAERNGVPVLRQPFLEIDFGSQRFAAITFWAVLEHLAEPRRFLAKAVQILEPGGHCFVLVPNLDSLAIRILGPRYRYVMPEHLNYFSAATLRRLVAAFPDLEIDSTSTTHFNPVVIWRDWRTPRKRVPDAERATLLRQTTRWKESATLAAARWLYSGVELLLGKLNLADNLVLVLRRR